ncbi:hypothetical protein AB0I24_16385 [Brachybacterium paraconglomeratum]
MEPHPLRGPVRRIAACAFALALALGTAACTGGDDEQPAPETPSATPSASADAAPEASDGGGDVSDADLSAATDRFLGFLGVIDDQDWEAACGYVLDPGTGAAPEGERLQQCADGARGAMADYEEMLEPGVFDQLDASMVQAEPAADGTISLSLLEQPVEIPMTSGDDGQWYLSIPF